MTPRSDTLQDVVSGSKTPDSDIIHFVKRADGDQTPQAIVHGQQTSTGRIVLQIL